MHRITKLLVLLFQCIPVVHKLWTNHLSGYSLSSGAARRLYVRRLQSRSDGRWRSSLHQRPCVFLATGLIAKLLAPLLWRCPHPWLDGHCGVIVNVCRKRTDIFYVYMKTCEFLLIFLVLYYVHLWGFLLFLVLFCLSFLICFPTRDFIIVLKVQICYVSS